MPESGGFHFAQPLWLWALLALVPVALWLALTTIRVQRGPIHRYADPHLLPHLTGTRDLSSGERWGQFVRWSLLWVLAVVALAGPRWDFTDMRLFRPGSDLVILLDISRSMQVADVQPSRLGRARQEIFDLVDRSPPLRIGLIAFASTAHVIAPLTEDTNSLRLALPSLSTDLVRLQGSRLNAALERAQQLLQGQPDDSSRSILLISDGDFDEPGLESRVRELARSGVRLIILGIGTEDGAAVPAADGGWLLDRARNPIESTLHEDLLRRLADAGDGLYLQAGFRDDDTARILKLALERTKAQEAGDEQTRVWNERFYLLVLPLLLLLLPRYRVNPVRRRVGP